MLRIAFLITSFCLAVALCAVGYRTASFQTSPIRRVTNTSEQSLSLNPSLSGDGLHLAFESNADLLGTGGTNQLRISKFASNGETLLKSIPITPAPAAGATFRLKASAVASATGTGTTLTATIGAKTISVDDPTWPSGTIGVLINPGAAVGPHSVDNFCASIGGTCP